MDFGGEPPLVAVVVGFALPATYTIAAVPPDHDFTKALPFFTSSTPEEVDADHSLAPVWGQVSAGWLIVVFGGIGGLPDALGFAVNATLSQSGQNTNLTVSVVEGTSAATFFASVELQP